MNDKPETDLYYTIGKLEGRTEELRRRMDTLEDVFKLAQRVAYIEGYLRRDAETRSRTTGKPMFKPKDTDEH